MQLETDTIENATSIEILADGYISKADSYLLLDNFQKANENYKQGYEFALEVTQQRTRNNLEFRALFGMAICCSEDQSEELINEIIIRMMQIMQTSRCGKCQKQPVVYTSRMNSKK